MLFCNRSHGACVHSLKQIREHRSDDEVKHDQCRNYCNCYKHALWWGIFFGSHKIYFFNNPEAAKGIPF